MLPDRDRQREKSTVSEWECVERKSERLAEKERKSDRQTNRQSKTGKDSQRQRKKERKKERKSGIADRQRQTVRNTHTFALLSAW